MASSSPSAAAAGLNTTKPTSSVVAETGSYRFASGLYYDFFYKQSTLTFLIPMAAAFLVYYCIYVPYYRRLSYRVRPKKVTRL
jgi:hypothetical protein